MKLPAGYYIDNLAGGRRELRGPQGTSVIELSGYEDPDSEILARVHWNGYHAGVLHALRAIRDEAAREGGIAMNDELARFEHELLHQVHIV